MYLDEAGFYLLPFVSCTWAPRGQTPVIEEKAGREHLSLIAAMAPNGRLYVGGQDKAYDSEGVIEFLEYLCRRYRRKNLIVVWDGATIHRSKAVKEFLSRRKGRVHLVALPGYSPELNPVELLWSQLKRGLKNQRGRPSGVPQSGRPSGSVDRKNRRVQERHKTAHLILPQEGDSFLYRLIHPSIV